MKILAKVLAALLKTLAVIVLVIAAYVVFGFLVAPVYRFAPAQPLSGEHIYNPYAGTSDTTIWRRANFHAHTRLRFNLTYGAKSPAEVVADYRSYGYDIIALSNYQTITRYEPASREEYNIPVYEHGYNPLMFHQLAFGKLGHTSFDIFLPLFTWQKQFILNRVGRKADIFSINHPNFSRHFPLNAMRELQNYRLIEAETGMAGSSHYWDEGLSAGRASFGISGDDSHNTARTHDIATNMTFVGSRSTKYADILAALRAGRHYALKAPDFGDGDTTVKHAMNRLLPRLVRAELRGDTIEVAFSTSARIDFIGQGGQVKQTGDMTPGTAKLAATGTRRQMAADTSSAKYLFGPADSYIRVQATFPNGVHIFLNPFFRYAGDDPFAIAPLRVRVGTTMAKDVVCAAFIVVPLYMIFLIVKPKKRHGKDKRSARNK